MDTKVKLESAAVKQLAKILNDTGLSEIEYEHQGCRIRVARTATSHVSMPAMHTAPLPDYAAAPTAPHPKDASPREEEPSGFKVKSPMVGVCYLAPEPGASTFVSIGDQVSEGQTLLIIEAMKVMNPIKAPRAGVIKSILVSDASPVEYDEVLLTIE